MFDLRYHVASLAAVFLALVIGILFGVGISGRGIVDDAERDNFNREIASLREARDAGTARIDDLERRQQAAEEFVASAYPVLVEGRLIGKRVAVLVVGSFDQTLDWVQGAVDDAGGRVVRIRALGVPMRSDEVERALASRPALGGYVGQGQLDNLGRDLARELVAGGRMPLWTALSSVLVEQRSGESVDPADGLVVIRSKEPQEGDTARFLSGVYAGAASTGEPAVGVELSRVLQSAIPVFQRHGLSTVDGVDSPIGRLALVLLLGGADPGDYGIRDTADDGILPPIEPIPVPSG